MKGSFEKKKKTKNKNHPQAHHGMKADRTFAFLIKGNMNSNQSCLGPTKSCEVLVVFLLLPLTHCPPFH